MHWCSGDQKLDELIRSHLLLSSDHFKPLTLFFYETYLESKMFLKCSCTVSLLTSCFQISCKGRKFFVDVKVLCIFSLNAALT